MCRAILSLAIVLSLGVGATRAQDQETRPWWQDGKKPVSRPERNRAEEDDPDAKPRGVMIQVLIATVVFDESGKVVITLTEDGQPAKPETVAVGTLPTLHAEYQNRATEAAAAPLLGSADAVNRLLEGLSKADALQQLVRPQLLTVDGREAMVQVGYRQPKITGVSRSPRGQTNQVTLENLGTLVTATPHVVPDGTILVELSVETSDFGPQEDATVLATSDDGPEIRSPRTDTLVVETTVSTRSGQTVIVSDQIRTWPGKVTETFVLLTAHLLD